MALDHEAFKDRLTEAVDEYDRATAGELVDELTDHLATSDTPYPLDDARDVMNLLRRKRFFGELTRAGDAFISAGRDEPAIRRRLGQALIEAGMLYLAETVLETVVADTPDGDPENREAKGLLGRACKQAYVDAGAPTDRAATKLTEAAAWYHSVYQHDPGQLWHGINTVAVLMRAARDAIEVPGYPDPKGIATDILEVVEGRRSEQTASMWDFGTALEACVALERSQKDTVEWAEQYVGHPNADAFEFGSTLRQLQEVWQLTADEEPGSWLIPLLQTAILKREDGAIDFEGVAGHAESLREQLDDGSLEAVLGTEYFEDMTWLVSALERARSVAKISDQGNRAMGTGFVVTAGDLGLPTDDPDELLLVTNAHVVSRDPDEGAVTKEEAKIAFERDEAGTEYTVAEILRSYPIADLDATILRTDPPIDRTQAVPFARVLPKSGSRVYVIGHPQGRPLSWSIYDNQLLNKDDPFLHYRTPTQGGSSGSPVFNRDWQLIGLHHKGDLRIEIEGQEGRHPANEGISLDAIKARIAEEE